VWRSSGHGLPPAIAWAITFVFVVVTWVFFRAQSVPDAWAIIRAMTGMSPMADWPAVQTLLSANIAALCALIAGTLIVFRRRNSNELVDSFDGSWMAAAAATAALTLAVLQLSTVAPFLYFNF